MPLYYYSCSRSSFFFSFFTPPFPLLPSLVWICRFRTPAYTLLISIAHTFISCFLIHAFFFLTAPVAPYILGRFLRTLLVHVLRPISSMLRPSSTGTGILGSTLFMPALILSLRSQASSASCPLAKIPAHSYSSIPVGLFCMPSGVFYRPAIEFGGIRL